MKTFYQIKYKIIEGSKTYQGIRVVEEPVREYIEVVHKNYRDATFIFVELIDEVERTASSSEVVAGGGLIIMPYFVPAHLQYQKDWDASYPLKP